MNISVTCAHCKKRYQVDAKLGGRKMKCKQCGQVIAIPDPADELLEPVEHQPAPPPPLPAKKSPPLPPMPRSQAEPLEQPEFGLAPPPMPAAPVLSEEGVLTTPEPAPKVIYRAIDYNQEERDFRGFRPSRDHTNGMLRTLDALVVVIGQIIFWIDAALVLLGILLMMLALHQVNNIRRDHGAPPLPGIVFVVCIFLPLTWLSLYPYACAGMASFAANTAGKILMFDVPEEPRWRLISVDTVATVFTVIGAIIMVVGAMLGEGLGSGALSGAFGLLACFTFPLVIPLHFLLTWLVLRLKFTEALLAWLFISISHTIFWGTLFTLSRLLIDALA